MYTYTVIIPHKNVPCLLQRCIDSIPIRDDLHVIIVDDNSDPKIVDFGKFPGYDRKNTTIIFNKEGLGAGHARNVGLDNIGDTKWVFFCDSDDFFTPYLNEALDQYAEADDDMIIFTYNSVYSESLQPCNRGDKTHDRILKAKDNNDYDIIRYKVQIPYCKFIAYKNIKRSNIRYDEVMYSNDVMFAIKIGYISNKIKIDTNILYTQTEREGSLVKIIKKESIDCRYRVAKNALQYLKDIDRDQYHTNLFSFCYKYAKINIFLAVNCFFRALKDTDIKFWYIDVKACLEYMLTRR